MSLQKERNMQHTISLKNIYALHPVVHSVYVRISDLQFNNKYN
jgi:hypothetical protein